ncbi:MAG TPA: hypothetical protein ENJ54_03195 [Chloroflexi bacterium]|nr:hypothetical protein [Chloroflexota bacterium]
MKGKKNLIAIVGAVVVLFVALAVLKPAPQADVVVAARDLMPGHTLTQADLKIEQLPQSAIPADAFTSVGEAVGKTLAVARSAGDIIRQAHIGQTVKLAPDEREIGLHVVDASGLGGTLGIGDKVGVVAVIQSNDMAHQGTFSKAMIEGLRVTYIDPDFVARDPQEVQAMPTAENGLPTTYRERAHEGVINVAVPVDMQAVVYDFGAANAPDKVYKINALELLSALSSASNATLYLYRMGDGAKKFTSSGLWLPDLIVFPATATPTPTPEGWKPGMPTPTPAATPSP